MARRTKAKAPETVADLRRSAAVSGAVRCKSRRTYLAAHFTSAAQASKWAAMVPQAVVVDGKPTIVLARLEA